MNNVRGFVSESTNELRDDITKAVNSTVRNDLEQWLTGSRTSEKQGDQVCNKQTVRDRSSVNCCIPLFRGLMRNRL